MRILLVGASAVGGYFGGRLVQAGRDVSFLVRLRRAEQIRASGWQTISPHGDATIEPNLITASDVRSAYDIIFLSVKSYGLAGAMNDFAPNSRNSFTSPSCQPWDPHSGEKRKGFLSVTSQDSAHDRLIDRTITQVWWTCPSRESEKI